jgi:DNA-binding beta-propeller fold protein YncE
MWVTNQGDDSITRLDSVGGRFATYRAGKHPTGIAFDGSYMWVTNYASNTLAKYQVSDGKLLGTFATGSGPTGVAFDGANMWVVNSGSSTVSKM